MAIKKNSGLILSNINKVSKIMPAADLLSTMKMFIEINRENNQTKREIALIDAKINYLSKEIEMKYDLYYKVFGQIFAERRMAIDKSFEIIDKGIKEDDKDLIQMGLSSLSTVVSSSPFNNLKELGDIINNNGIIEL